MKFSVLIPVYNVETSLKQCIESVLTQSFKDYEIILVNDGSTDRSGVICDEYSRMYPFIKTIHKNNDGLYMARVDGMKNASGKYYFFLDSDDTIESNTLEEINNILLRDSEIDMVIFREKLIYIDKNISIDSPVLYNEGYVTFDKIAELLTKTTDINNLVMKCIRAPKQIDFSVYHHFNMAEDVAFTCQFLEKCEKYYYTKQIFYNYRLNNNSITHRVTPDNLINASIARSHIYRMLSNRALLNKLGRPLINEYIKNIAYFISEIEINELKSDYFKKSIKCVETTEIWKYTYSNASFCRFSNRIFMILLNKKLFGI